jgi:hypothetical protein
MRYYSDQISKDVKDLEMSTPTYRYSHSSSHQIVHRKSCLFYKFASIDLKISHTKFSPDIDK